MYGIRLAEAGIVPDPLIRFGIRRLLASRIRSIARPDCEDAEKARHALREELRRGPIATATDLANQQHYEVAAAFFERVLGRHMKYSCGHWREETRDLDDAEASMLALTARRAQICDGMQVLDLGCGWGSLSLYIAARFPTCGVLAVSNSESQREFITKRCQQRGIDNIEVVTDDVQRFAPDRRFDRVVSVEMFEHVRNHELLLRRIASWLRPGGKLFVHHFAHRHTAYPFEDEGAADWMAREFFSGGIMPSDDLLLHLQRDLHVERKWTVGGVHYRKTAEAWLQRQDAARDQLLPILAEVYGADDAALWFQRWRIFFLACAELFGYRGGNEWWVTHVRMSAREGER